MAFDRDLRFWLTQCLGILLARQGGETVITEAEINEALRTDAKIRTESTGGSVRVWVDTGGPGSE